MASSPRLCRYAAHGAHTLFRVKSVVNRLSTESVGIVLTYLDIACAARSSPSHPPRVVYQTLLERSTTTQNERPSAIRSLDSFSRTCLRRHSQPPLIRL